MTTNTAPVTLTVKFNANQINMITEIVSLGCREAREHASQDNRNDRAADNAVLAVMTLSNAFARAQAHPAETEGAMWSIKCHNQYDPNLSFYSQALGWTCETRADRFSLEDTTASTIMATLASVGTETGLHRVTTHTLRGCGWVAFSASKANTEGAGYWTETTGWGNLAAASEYGYSVPMDSNLPPDAQDSLWLNLRLAEIEDEEGLSTALAAFCKTHGLELKCAAELLYEQLNIKYKDVRVTAWLKQFNRQWEVLMDAAA